MCQEVQDIDRAIRRRESVDVRGQRASQLDLVLLNQVQCQYRGQDLGHRTDVVDRIRIGGHTGVDVGDTAAANERNRIAPNHDSTDAWHILFLAKLVENRLEVRGRRGRRRPHRAHQNGANAKYCYKLALATGRPVCSNFQSSRGTLAG